MAQILFLTEVLPYPLDAGPKVRAYYVLRYLAQQHSVTLVSFVRPDDKPSYLEELKSFCHRVYTAPLRRSRWADAQALLKATIRSASVVLVRDQVPEMYALLTSLLQEQHYDAIHADQTSMAQYGEFARAYAQELRPDKPVRLVLDAHNALFCVFEQLAAGTRNPLRRLFLQRESRALERYERGAYGQFHRTVYVADQDRAILREDRSADNQAYTIPICVEPEGASITPVDQPYRVTHLGTMFWPPNVEGVLWFGREVMPRVAARVPEARLTVIGKRPPAAIRELAARPYADVLGYVANPTPYLAETAAFVVPLHAGAGMRVKILDAWCWGLPIVTTTLGAEGIAAVDGEHLLVADDAASFADAVVRLVREPELRARLIQNGARQAREQYDWRVIYRQWDQVYDGLPAGGA